jgi:hypothetical protein
VHPEVVERQAVADLVGVERPADLRDRRMTVEGEQPPGRSRRAASGTVRYGSANVIPP